MDELSKLEYRRDDSAGIAVRDGENLVEVIKARVSSAICLIKQMRVERFAALVVLDILVGQHMVRQVRQMHILMYR
ncbi:hypothetical protein HMPREF1355_02081 [Enterococcus faecium 515]|nr:hypothetical protein HMPREF1355_02081 [Enterococcus faecium 515]